MGRFTLRDLPVWEPEKDEILFFTDHTGGKELQSWLNVSHEARVLRARVGAGHAVPAVALHDLTT